MNKNIIIAITGILLFLISCNKKAESTLMKIGDVVKISSELSSYNIEEVTFAWIPPKASDGSMPKFEIKDNSFYFSPSLIGEHMVELSIETSKGELIINEFFPFDAVEQLSEGKKTYTNIKFPSDMNKIEESTPSSYFTVQIYARLIESEALTDLSKLEALGYEDVFIEEFIEKDKKYWRVRNGIFNSLIKAKKRQKEISSLLKIGSKDLWVVEVK